VEKDLGVWPSPRPLDHRCVLSGSIRNEDEDDDEDEDERENAMAATPRDQVPGIPPLTPILHFSESDCYWPSTIPQTLRNSVTAQACAQQPRFSWG